jgi:hypothetical protein
VGYNYQIGENKINLLTEYENVAQKFYLATLFQRAGASPQGSRIVG